MKLINNTFLKCIFGAESKENFNVDGAVFINQVYFVTQVEVTIPITENIKVAKRIKLDDRAHYELGAKIIYEF